MSLIVNDLMSDNPTRMQIAFERIEALCLNAASCNGSVSPPQNRDPEIISVLKGSDPFETHFLEAQACYFSISSMLFVPWLEAVGAKIAVSRALAGNEEVLSGPFSGCYMALFTAGDGTRRIAHIQTSEGPNADNHAAWNTTHYTNVQLIRPKTPEVIGQKSYAIYDLSHNIWYNILYICIAGQPRVLSEINTVGPQTAADIVKRPGPSDCAHQSRYTRIFPI